MGNSYDIAIIGMACIFPKAPNLRTFWENILAKVDGIDDAPDDWGADRFLGDNLATDHPSSVFQSATFVKALC